MAKKTVEDYLAEAIVWKETDYPSIEKDSSEFPLLSSLMSPFFVKGVSVVSENEIHRCVMTLYQTALASALNDLESCLHISEALVERMK